jgi:hypothetical protein
MEILLIPILLPLGFLSLWLKSGRKKSVSELWKQHGFDAIQAEGVAFILGSFALVMGIALLTFSLVMSVLFIIRAFSK